MLAQCDFLSRDPSRYLAFWYHCYLIKDLDLLDARSIFDRPDLAKTLTNNKEDCFHLITLSSLALSSVHSCSKQTASALRA
jgi:hypothetical protein